MPPSLSEQDGSAVCILCFLPFSLRFIKTYFFVIKKLLTFRFFPAIIGLYCVNFLQFYIYEKGALS